MSQSRDVSLPTRIQLRARFTKTLVFILAVSANLVACSRSAVADKPEEPTSWNVKIVPENEPGEPLIVSGTIYSPDGKQHFGRHHALRLPDRRDRSLYDDRRRESRLRASAESCARTRRVVTSFARLSPALIRTAVIPRTFTLTSLDRAILSTGSTSIISPTIRTSAMQTSKERAPKGAFSPILNPTRGADGILRATRDIRIERCSRNCTGH